MAITNIPVDAFVETMGSIPVLDVRSPGEYVHAKIPGAISFPLFSDEERKVVGTAYKQESREIAIKKGLAFFGPKMVQFVEEAEAISKANGGSKKLLVHCWRGGMRSAAMVWLLNLYGFDIYLLTGGYKAFRNWVLQQFQKEYTLNVLGGYTGSGKTYVLQQLRQKHKAVVDLEGLANHKGSAFGAINMPTQPSQEMFENLVATSLYTEHKRAGENGIWIEDESQRIGLVNVPVVFWQLLRKSKLYFLEIDFESRLNHIISDYGNGDKDKLIEATTRIQKRLGGLETKTAIAFLQEANLAEGFRILLKYYDRQYTKGLHSRDNLQELLQPVPFGRVEPAAIAQLLIDLPVANQVTT